MKRELKWKSDAEAAAAAASASASPGSSDVVDHQQSVVRSCISRLRRGSDFKKTVTPARLPRATGAAAVSAKTSSMEEEEEEEQVMNDGGGDVTKKAVVMTTVSRGRCSVYDITPMTSSRGGGAGDTVLDRRRQQVLAMLNTAEGQRMVQQMFVVRDELKQELASLAQRLKRIDHRIETMLRARSTSTTT